MISVHAKEAISAGSTVSGERTSESSRLKSLDILRGVTIAVMILVNTSGDGNHTYSFLSHSVWNGCTLADVVFPCFLFMVGISLVFSLSARLKRGDARSTILLDALKRALIIFALGLAVNGFPLFHLQTLRIFGVLQRISLCFLFATLVYLWGRPKSLVVLLVSILVGYWILLRWVPVPGFGMPGSDVAFLDPHGNLPAWLDRHLLPASHLYHQGYYDPEGLLSTISSIASTVLGVLCGIWMKRTIPAGEKAKGLLVAGLVCLVSGLVWSIWFPLNKRLWTSSFVLFTGGISVLALWLFFRLIDLRKSSTKMVYPAIVFGTNSLAVYIFSEFFAELLRAVKIRGSSMSLQASLYRPIAAVIPDPYIAALLYAILFVGVCFLPIWFLYRKRIFIKV